MSRVLVYLVIGKLTMGRNRTWSVAMISVLIAGLTIAAPIPLISTSVAALMTVHVTGILAVLRELGALVGQIGSEMVLYLHEVVLPMLV